MLRVPGAIVAGQVAAARQALLERLRALEIRPKGRRRARLRGKSAFQETGEISSLLHDHGNLSGLLSPSVIALVESVGIRTVATHSQWLVSLPSKESWRLDRLNWHRDAAGRGGRRPPDRVGARRSRLRRGILYRVAGELGATKIALGHHRDDVLATFFLNLFHGGQLKAMPAKLVSDDARHVVIRPLVYVGEEEARLYTKEVGLPIIGCCCPACGDLSLQRQRVKRLIMDLEVEHAGVRQSMLKALGNVMPRHLLDTRLNPSGELRDSVAARLEDEGPATPLIQIRH